MTINEEKGNLFALPTEYALVHCISEDCQMGAGIAVEFQKRFLLREKLRKFIYNYKEHYPCAIGCRIPYNGRIIFNMITKKNYWDKPTKENFEKALDHLVCLCKRKNVTKLGMPRIGCGLDRLQWSWVKSKIEEKFADMDIEIQVRYL